MQSVCVCPITVWSRGAQPQRTTSLLPTPAMHHHAASSPHACLSCGQPAPHLSRKFYRQDVVLTNARGQRLQASHYRPCVTTSPDGRLPCVVYLHCECFSVLVLSGRTCVRTVCCCLRRRQPALRSLSACTVSAGAGVPTQIGAVCFDAVQVADHAVHRAMQRQVVGKRRWCACLFVGQPWIDSSWFHRVLHAGNSGSRRDAEEVLYHLLPKGMTVFAFDFAVRPRSARNSAMTAELSLFAEG